jgi:hypothetical protein
MSTRCAASRACGVWRRADRTLIGQEARSAACVNSGSPTCRRRGQRVKRGSPCPRGHNAACLRPHKRRGHAPQGAGGHLGVRHPATVVDSAGNQHADGPDGLAFPASRAEPPDPGAERGKRPGRHPHCSPVRCA